MRRFRIPHLVIAIAAAGSAAPTLAAPEPVQAGAAQGALAPAIADEAGGAIKKFYAERDFRPLWITGGRVGPQAETLIGYLSTAGLDGLKPSSYKVDDLREKIAEARSGDPRLLARAEIALSKAFASYARDQRKQGARMDYADKALKPRKAKPDEVLRAASFPKSFANYMSGMEWMSPLYVRIRDLAGRAEKRGLSDEARDRLRLNLDRARILPGPWTHHVVVDSSSGRLWYYGGGKQEGTMRVVVGAPETQTPMLVGNLQWAILNPYWNVPTYLARESIAPKVLAGRSLASLKMEALSDWSAEATKLPASSIDWHAVAAGDREIRLRELPGPANSMGRVKFLFPNDEGIYLHDTPERALLTKTDRHFSNGCIRLEKAAELGRWLMQKSIRAPSSKPEQAVPLPAQVPVYLTYLTAAATDDGLAFRADVYGRDQ